MFIFATKPESLWGQIQWIFEDNWPLFWYGIKVTVLLAIVGTLVGLIIGLFLGTLRTIEIHENDAVIMKITKRILHGFVNFYVWFFRGTPMMIQALLFYNLFRPILHWDAMMAGYVIISINTGAYMAEIVRSGIQSVDHGQKEGARSIGMSNTQTMTSIILPQAIKNSFPSIGNQFVVNIKDSSMLNVIGVIDLFFQTSSVAGSSMLYIPTFVITTMIYLVLTTIATFILNLIENRLDTAQKGNV
ncbi:MAG: amino acid ABC transporter permease [Breznakia sp.]